MKKLALILTSFTLAVALKAQVYTILPHEPLANFVGIEDLWNIGVTAPPNGTLQQCQIIIDVTTDAGIPVLTSKSAYFSLPAGNSQYNKFAMAALKPVQNFISPGTNYSAIAGTGLLPANNYRVVYTLTGINQQGNTIVSIPAELVFTVEMLFPPNLLTPFNEDTIQTYNPVFAWSPAFSGAQRITYDIIVAEQLPGQSAEQAIDANPAYFKAENLLSTSISYPFSAAKLKANQWYAWRVIAKIGSVPASRTESWRFIIVEPKDDPCTIKPVDHYYQLEEKPTGNYALIKNGQLNFYFNEIYSMPEGDLIFNILNVKGKTVASNKSIQRVYKPGHNYNTILLTENDASLPKGYYSLEVYMQKDKKLYLRFELKNDVSPCVNE